MFNLNLDLNSMPPPSQPTDYLSREEFETFLQVLTHEIRNRLNGIALEATDLAELAGPQTDSHRLQQQVQECSAFLKAIREITSAHDLAEGKTAFPELVKKIKERNFGNEK